MSIKTHGINENIDNVQIPGLKYMRIYATFTLIHTQFIQSFTDARPYVYPRYYYKENITKVMQK